MKNVLYIALEFAPQNNTGTYRSLKFVKYFPKFEIVPTVITLEEKSGAEIFGKNLDYNLLEDIKEIDIKRIQPLIKNKPKNRFLNYLSFFFNIDDGIANQILVNFKREFDDLIKNQDLAAVIITFPPFSCYTLFQWIKKNYTIPVVVDFRDAWSGWGNNYFTSYVHFLLIKNRELTVFKNANLILTVTNELKEQFIRTHGDVFRDKIKVISNGIDYDLKLINDTVEFNNLCSEKIRIGYIGSFYFDPRLDLASKEKWFNKKLHRILHYSRHVEDWKYRSPYFFLKTLWTLFKQKPELRGRVEFIHIGHRPEWIDDMLAEFSLNDIFIPLGFMSQSDALREAEKFDFLLATSEKRFDGPHYCLPSKVFDYVLLNKPILGFLTEGSQKIFLNSLGSALLLDPDNIGQNVEELHRIMTNGFVGKVNKVFLENYKREYLTNIFSKVIHNI